MTTIGLLHPGEMGAAVGEQLVRAGHEVWWLPAGRSAASAQRADRAGLRPAADLDALLAGCAVLLSICPPHAAADVAGQATGYRGVYVDANAVAPRTVRALAARLAAGGARVVDGGIVGGPPGAASGPRLVLSGGPAAEVAGLFDGTTVAARVVGPELGAASALKAAYAGWTKGSAALLLTVRRYAAAAGVGAELDAEWADSQPQLAAQAERARASAAAKGWRWAGEMTEIATALADEDLPRGFHDAAAQVYRRPTD